MMRSCKLQKEPFKSGTFEWKCKQFYLYTFSFISSVSENSLQKHSMSTKDWNDRTRLLEVFFVRQRKKGRNNLRSNCNFDFTKYPNMYFITVWKFQDFSGKQILREIKISEFRVLKFAILTNWEALNFDFYEFLHCLKAEISQIN